MSSFEHFLSHLKMVVSYLQYRFTMTDAAFANCQNVHVHALEFQETYEIVHGGRYAARLFGIHEQGVYMMAIMMWNISNP